MDRILSGLQDIVKFKAIGAINTGDKTFDNLINTLVITLISIAFSTAFWTDNWKKLTEKCKRKQSMKSTDVLCKKNFKKLQEVAAEIEYQKCTWIISKNIEFTTRLIAYLMSSECDFIGGTFYNFSIRAFETTEDSDAITIADFFLVKNICSKFANHFPIFITTSGRMICLGSSNQMGSTRSGEISVHLYYETKEDLEEFYRHLLSKNYNISADSEKKKATIYDYSKTNPKVGTIFPDRTFDTFISRHKEQIMSTINRFKMVNSNENYPFTNHNMGFLVYGLPGTGKTSFIKALCNYLGRNAYLVDMRGVKTSQDFLNLFNGSSGSNIKDFVYVFEEFDCVQGVIKKRTHISIDEIEEKSSTSIKKELREQYMEYLQQLQKTTEENIKKELKMNMDGVMKKIAEIDNALTLDTILQVLDGMCEMRERVIVATTNHVDKIDPALLRSGRFDLKLEFGYFNNTEIKELLAKIFHQANATDIAYLNGSTFPEDKFVPAEIINLSNRYGTLRRVVETMLE